MATDDRHPILLLGGTGKVASRLSARLQADGFPVIIASRKGLTPEYAPHASGVPFNWLDKATYENAFVHPWAIRAGGIREVFLVAPPGVLDPSAPMRDFIDLAVEKGVTRLVLLSASAWEEGGTGMGAVHAHLRKVGLANKGVEWAVLRPSWFMENFSTFDKHIQSIKNESCIYSATDDGRIPFISADDIAACAASLLTTSGATNADHLILGDELLSYGDVAAILSDVLGRTIVHKTQTPAELAARLEAGGTPRDYAEMLAALDTDIKHGVEEKYKSDAVLALTGRRPRRFREWADGAKQAWL